jgi:hypothetical protein
MRALRQWSTPFLMLCLSFAVAAPASAESRPFSVVLDGNAAPVFLDMCTIQNTETGTGHGTHLGTITWESTEMVDLCAGGLVTGAFVITGANGDVITGTYETVATLNFMTNQVSADGVFTITGGTGRFASASGEGVITADGSLLPPFEVLGHMSGTIDY